MRRPATVTGLLLLALVAGSLVPLARAQPAATTGAAAETRVVLVGQALIKKDLRAVAPASFEQARAYLAGADVAFTNLEAAVAPPGAAVTPRSDSAVAGDVAVLDCLKDMGFNLLSLANNHATDLGQPGMRIARAEAARRGFVVAGTGENAYDAAAPGYLDTRSKKVALVAMASGAVQLTPDTWATPVRPGVNFLEVTADGTLNLEQKGRILDGVRAAARQGALVIAYQHNHYWGPSRGADGPPGRERRVDRFTTPAWMEAWARELIDAGASIYVGHGDPALHGVEIYKGRLILYGLGNYVFQSEGTLDKYGPLAYYSAVVDARFVDGRAVAVRFTPLVLAMDPPARGAPFVAQGGEAAAVLSRLADISQRYGTPFRIERDWAEVLIK